MFWLDSMSTVLDSEVCEHEQACNEPATDHSSSYYARDDFAGDNSNYDGYNAKGCEPFVKP